MLKGNILFFFFFHFKKFVPALQQHQPLTERSNTERLELNEWNKFKKIAREIKRKREREKERGRKRERERKRERKREREKERERER